MLSSVCHGFVPILGPLEPNSVLKGRANSCPPGTYILPMDEGKPTNQLISTSFSLALFSTHTTIDSCFILFDTLCGFQR